MRSARQFQFNFIYNFSTVNSGIVVTWNCRSVSTGIGGCDRGQRPIRIRPKLVIPLQSNIRYVNNEVSRRESNNPLEVFGVKSIRYVLLAVVIGFPQLLHALPCPAVAF